MKTTAFFLVFFALIFSINFSSKAQTDGLSISITKTNNSLYAVNEVGKHTLNFDVTGITSQRQADNLLKFVRSYRGVEEFNLIKTEGTNSWKASGIFYEYAEMPYFKNLFKLMKVTEVYQDNVKTTIENL